MLNEALRQIPKGRIGKPEDVGAAAVFLASNEADYITGTVIYVDGGWLAG
jgi:NAD(P)-dependent dehydrogenase (short-subunit alcohol dehydrogenase family)